MARLNWRGRELVAKVATASAMAIDKTMADCVGDADHNHEWDNETGFLEGSTTIIGFARFDGRRVRGSWGSTADYALFIEIGTSRIGPTAEERETAAHGNMWEVPPTQPADGVTVRQSFTILPPGTMEGQEDWVTLHTPSIGTGPLMEPRPWLRPAADRNYPMLASYIRMALAGESL